MSNPPSVQITRTFDAPPATVWRSWTEAPQVSRWFGSDPAGRVLSAQLDVRPGGRFAVCFQDGNGTEHECRGIYAEVVTGSTLRFSWQWRSEPGRESQVTVHLQPQDGGTLMQFEHARLAGDSLHDYAAGWRRTFDKLARVLADSR